MPKTPHPPSAADKKKEEEETAAYNLKLHSVCDALATCMQEFSDIPTVVHVNALLRCAALLAAEEGIPLLKLVAAFAAELDSANEFVTKKHLTDLSQLITLMQMPAKDMPKA